MSRSRSHRWILVGFCAWLVLLPLPFGANRTWALSLALLTLAGLAMAAAWWRRGALPLWKSLLQPPVLPVTLFALLGAAQCLPWPGASLSVAPHATLVHLLVTLGCIVTMWMVRVLVRSDRDLSFLLGALVACGLVQSVIAVALLAAGPTFSLPVLDSELKSAGVASGTLLSRNSLAAYLNIALAAGIGLMIGQLAPPAPGRSWRIMVRDWLEVLLGGKARLRLLLILLVIVLIATRSRMGNASFFIALVIATSVFAIFARERRRGLMLFVGSVVVIDLFLIGAWVGVDRVIDRIQNTPLLEQMSSSSAPSGAAAPGQVAGTGGDAPAPKDPRREQSVEDRIEPALDAVRIVREHAWLGTGGGTFYLVYMAYQPNWEGFYNHAHNDYLEIAADTGLVGLGLLMLAALSALWAVLDILRRRSHPMLRGAAFASLMAIAAIATHATVDYILQIPAIAMTFSAMIALPFAARALGARSHASRTPARDDEPAPDAGRRRRSGAEAAVALATVLALAAGGWYAARLGLADTLSIQASMRMAQWEAGGSLSPAQAESIESTLSKAIALDPLNGGNYETLGTLYFARAVAPGRTPEGARIDFSRSVSAYREATQRSRVSGYAWGNLMIAKHFAGQFDVEFSRALRNAVRYAPLERAVQAMVLTATLPRWAMLSSEERGLAADTVLRGWELDPKMVVAEAWAAAGREAWCAADPGLPNADQRAALAKLCAAVASYRPPQSGRRG